MVNSENIKHSLWVEKYRPNVLENYIADESFKKILARYIEEQDTHHLLLAGRAGTGKTTCSKILVNNIACEHIYINGSMENGVEAVRDKIYNFASTHGFEDLKIVIIDEFDYFTPNAQAALRNLMETFSSRVRFIFTCNYIEKIIDPIQSRSQVFMLEPPDKAAVAEHVVKILDNENVTYQIEDVASIVNKYYPDIRRCIQTLQQSSSGGKLELVQKNLIEKGYMSSILETLKDDKSPKSDRLKRIRQIIADTKQTNFVELYSFLFEHIDEYASGHIGQVILYLDDGQFKDSQVVDKQLHIIRVIAEILLTI